MTARYQPGPHPARVAARGVVLTEATRVSELVGLTGEVTVLGVVQALSRGVLTDLPGFAVALVEGEDLRVVVRGGYDVRVGDQSWSGAGVATWSEQLVAGAAGGEVVLGATGAAPSSDGLPLTEGVVLVDVVTWAAHEEPAAVAEPEQAPEGLAARSARASTDLAEAEPDPAPQPEPAQPEQGEAVATFIEEAPEEAAEQAPGMVTPPPAPSFAPAIDDPGATQAEGRSDFDALFGATVVGKGRQPAPEPPQQPAGLGDHDGHTVAAGAIRKLREQGGSFTPPPAAAPAQPKATLELSSGNTVTVDRPVLIGRSPRAAQTSGAALPAMVVVDDPYVSGTHLEVSFQGTSLVATDRSTNGTLLTRPGRPAERLVKDVPTVLTTGSVLSLSDDLTASVTIEGA